jgi:ADP-ribose diphosphatase
VASLKRWSILSSETLVERAPWMRLMSQKVELPNGVVIDDYLVSVERDYTMIVAVTDDDRVLVVEQYKHGLAGLLREFPAGYVDDGETAGEAAARELREETGYASGRWTALGSFCISPNRGPATAHFFLAERVTQVGAPRLDATEDLTFELVPRTEVDRMLRAGEMPSLANAAAWGLAGAALNAP